MPFYYVQLKFAKAQIPPVYDIGVTLFYLQFVSQQSGFAFFGVAISVAAPFYFLR